MKILKEMSNVQDSSESDVLGAMYNAYANLDNFITACDRNRMGLIFDRKAITLQDKQGTIAIGLKSTNDYNYIASKSLVLDATNMYSILLGKKSS